MGLFGHKKNADSNVIKLRATRETIKSDILGDLKGLPANVKYLIQEDTEFTFKFRIESKSAFGGFGSAETIFDFKDLGNGVIQVTCLVKADSDRAADKQVQANIKLLKSRYPVVE